MTPRQKKEETNTHAASMDSPVFAGNIDVDTINIGPVEVDKKKRRSVNVTNARGGAISCQLSEDNFTNRQRVVWAPSPGMNKTVDLESRLTLEATIESPKVLEVMKKLDDKMFKTAADRSLEWIGKTMDENVIRNSDMYPPIVRSTDKSGYENVPTMKIKISKDSPAFDAEERARNAPYFTIIEEVLDEKDGRIVSRDADFRVITPGSMILVVMDISQVWFIGKQKFGLQLKANKIMVWPRRNTPVTSFLLAPGSYIVKSAGEGNDDPKVVEENDPLPYVAYAEGAVAKEDDTGDDASASKKPRLE